MNTAARMSLLATAVFASGCNSLLAGKSEPLLLPHTLGEHASGYGYVPLDGLAIEPTLQDESCKPWRKSVSNPSFRSTPRDLQGDRAGQDPYRPLLASLPDISVRFAVASFDASGGLTFGPSQITAQGHVYRAILDYVNVDAIPVTFRISAFKDGVPINLKDAPKNLGVSYDAKAIALDEEPTRSTEETGEFVTIPVYVGIGMRLSADITALQGGVPLISLGAIGLEAQANRLTGTLTVQTIGITGQSIATSLPLPSKLDQTTIENGILAVGSSRAVVYRLDGEDAAPAIGSTVTTPRVVGLYSPIGSSPALINAIYSELSRQRPLWARPCKALT